jgi:hypothetical protein
LRLGIHARVKSLVPPAASVSPPTGATIAAYELPTSGATFVNDVVVTKRAAWFTDSQRAALYRLPLGPNGRPGPASSVTTVQLTGDYQHVPGAFNVNGIDATPNGRRS